MHRDASARWAADLSALRTAPARGPAGFWRTTSGTQSQAHWAFAAASSELLSGFPVFLGHLTSKIMRCKSRHWRLSARRIYSRSAEAEIDVFGWARSDCQFIRMFGGVIALP